MRRGKILELGVSMSEKNQLTIRAATPLDVVNLVRLLRQAWEEMQVTQVSRIDEQRAVEYVLDTIRDQFVAVADYHGRLVATIACSMLRERWSSDQFVAEEWFYVTPAYRGGTVAIALFAEAEDYADWRQLPMLWGINAVQPRELDELLRKRDGYRYLGGNYLRLPKVKDDGHQKADDDRENPELAGARLQASG